MKKVLCILGMLVMVISIMILTTPSAFAATLTEQRTSAVQTFGNPFVANYSGGGCTSPKESSPYGDLYTAACISYSSGYIRPDAYIDFRPNTSAHGQVTSCEAGVSLYDAGVDNLINNGPISDCIVAAQGRYNNYHIYGTTYQTNSGEYYSYAFVTIYYSDGYTSTGTSTSPVIYL